MEETDYSLDSGVDISTPSECSSSFSPWGTSDCASPNDQTPKNRKYITKRKLFRNADQENIKVAKRTEEKSDVNLQRLPLSERQQLALVLQLSEKETAIVQVPACESPELKKVTLQGNQSKRLTKRNERGETPLHVAAIKGDCRKVAQLVRQGASVNVADFAGWSPLHKACNHGWLSVARRLISAGACINAQGFDSFTPLHDAAVNGHVEIVKLLLQYGGDPLQKNSRGKTAVDLASSEKVKLLLTSFSENNPTEDHTAAGAEREVSGFSSPIPEQPLGPRRKLWQRQSPLPNKTNVLSHSTMRKNCPQNQAHKGAEKPTSPRLTLRFQSIKTKDEKNSGSSKANDVSSSQPKYQTYCVTMETRDVYEFRKDDPSSLSSSRVVSASASSSVTENCDNSQQADAVTSSKDVEAATSGSPSENAGPLESDAAPTAADSTETCNGGGNAGLAEYDYSSDAEKDDNCSKRRKSNDSSASASSKAASYSGGALSSSSSQRSQRVQGSKPQPDCDPKSSPKSRKRGNLSSSDTETTQSDGENENAAKNVAPAPPPPTLGSPSSSANQNGSPPGGSPHSPKVPPIKIVIPLVSSGNSENEARERSKVSASKQALPYVVSTEQLDTATDSGVALLDVGKSEGSVKCGKEEAHHSEERFHRVTRSSHRMALANAGGSSSVANSVGSSNESTSNSAVPSTGGGGGQKSEQSGESSTDEHHNLNQAELHPRKRKLRTRDVDSSSSQPLASSASSSSSVCDEQQSQASNSYQMYFNIRKQVDKRRKSMFVVHPKPPQGFKDYLLNRCSYVLEGNAASRISVPMIPPPQSLAGCMRDLFVQQEKERYKLRLQHLIERVMLWLLCRLYDQAAWKLIVWLFQEKLVLSAEQEILRVHGRAARAMANQTVPLSVCTILKDEEIYNILELEQESSYVLRKKALKTRGQWNGTAVELSDDKDKNVRSRYNGRLFLSWLQDVDDKWEKIKEAMLLRHHNEAESLHAVQKLDWEWKLKELTMCDVKTTPVIDDIYVPMVHVSDDFDLLPT